MATGLVPTAFAEDIAVEDAGQDTEIVSVNDSETAETVEAASGKCGRRLTWELDDEGTLTISGTGRMDEWQEDDYMPWWSHRKSIKSVVIQDGATTIGKFAFYECTNLESVEIPDTVTNIRSCSFQDSGLKSIDIPSSVKIIGDWVFYGCNNLTSIVIPDGVSQIGSRTFCDCSNLRNVTLPNTITNISDRMFSQCIRLTNVTIPEGITSINKEAFYGCISLKNITIPNSVTSIAKKAFFKCENLTDITLSDGVTDIGNLAFSRCDSLKRVTIPNNVARIGDSALFNCVNLQKIEVMQGNQNYSSSKGVLYNKSKTELIVYPTGKKQSTFKIPSSVKKFASRAFYKCNSLKNITFDGTKVKLDNIFANSNTIYDKTIKCKDGNVKYVGTFDKLKSVSSKSKGQLTAKWRTSQVPPSGYEVAYSQNEDFFGNTKILSVNGKSTSVTVTKGLESGQIYYVRMRQYTIKGTTTCYGDWSASKIVAVK